MNKFEHVRTQDPAVYAAMMRELERQRDHIELIASENFVSEAVLEAVGSHLTNKYAEGYPGARYYGGCQFIDEVENLARDRAKQLFGAEHANVQPHSGSQANTAVYLALLKPGDTIMGLDLSHGGHLTHGSKASISGKYFHSVFYGVSPDTETIDYDAAQRIAEENHPQIIIAGASAYPRFIEDGKTYGTVGVTEPAAVMPETGNRGGSFFFCAIVSIKELLNPCQSLSLECIPAFFIQRLHQRGNIRRITLTGIKEQPFKIGGNEDIH